MRVKKARSGERRAAVGIGAPARLGQVVTQHGLEERTGSDAIDQIPRDLLAAHHDAVQHLAEVRASESIPPSRSSRRSVPRRRRFPHRSISPPGWGPAPATEESAGVNDSHRCPKGNRQMRRVHNQAANAAVKARGTIFAVYRRLVPRLGHAQAIGAITHRLCRLIWKILHERVRYEERGPSVSAEAKKVRARKMTRELRSLGYRVEDHHSRSVSMSDDFRPWLIREAA